MKLFISLSTKVDEFTGTNGLYAWVQPTMKSAKDICEFVKPLQIPDPLDLHCTIMYSKTAPNNLPPETSALRHVDGGFQQWVGVKELVWWEGHDQSGYLVAKLVADNLKPLHMKWRDFGCKPTFDDYEPHVTLVNPCKLDDKLQRFIDERNEYLKSNHFGITLLHEQISDLSQ